MLDDRARAAAVASFIAIAMILGSSLGLAYVSRDDSAPSPADGQAAPPQPPEATFGADATGAAEATSSTAAPTTAPSTTLSSTTSSSTTTSPTTSSTTAPATTEPTAPQSTEAPTELAAPETTAVTPAPTTPEAAPNETAATVPEDAVEIVRPEDEVETAGFAGPVVVIAGRVERSDGLVLWDTAAHPVVAIQLGQAGDLWAITSSGALLTGNNESLAMAGDPTGLGYTTLALTNAHVVVASNSGAVVAYVRANPVAPRVMASPVGLDGVALPVARMIATGGEGVRVEAGGKVFLLSASVDGVAVDCGPIESASC